MPDPCACLWRRYYCQHHRGPFYQGSDLSPLYLAHYPDTADRVVGITGGKYCMAPYRWWSVSGTSLYALGTGLLFPVLFRFALFSHSLPKGTVSATINIVALSFMAASVEVARWVYFRAGGRIAFHCPALIAGIVVIMLVSRLLKLRQQHLLQPA